MAENIVHLVLARTPDAPEGVKGISLFVVPKFLVNADGSLGERNDVHCVSHRAQARHQGQPDRGAAVRRPRRRHRHLVGEENRGLEYMFIMMNAARFAVGMQGVAIAERAYQKAVALRQGPRARRDRWPARAGAGADHPPPGRAAHADDDARADRGVPRAGLSSPRRPTTPRITIPTPRRASAARRFYEYMVPLVKGWSTEMCIEVASPGVQVHGGMGFIEETGAAQYYRDARILTIYEGTTAIQANDLVGRKTVRDGGAAAKAIAARDRGHRERRCGSSDSEAAHAMARRLAAARQAFLDAVDFVVANAKSDPNAVFAGSVPYLMLAGNLVAGWQLAPRDAGRPEPSCAAGEDVEFMRNKIAVGALLRRALLTRVPGLRDSVVDGAAAVNDVPLRAF